MLRLKPEGGYEITEDMKGKLKDFYGRYGEEDEVLERRSIL